MGVCVCMCMCTQKWVCVSGSGCVGYVLEVSGNLQTDHDGDFLAGPAGYSLFQLLCVDACSCFSSAGKMDHPDKEALRAEVVPVVVIGENHTHQHPPHTHLC